MLPTSDSFCQELLRIKTTLTRLYLWLLKDYVRTCGIIDLASIKPCGTISRLITLHLVAEARWDWKTEEPEFVGGTQLFFSTVFLHFLSCRKASFSSRLGITLTQKPQTKPSARSKTSLKLMTSLQILASQTTFQRSSLMMSDSRDRPKSSKF